MVMISYFETNEINNTYVNLQTGQPLDLDRVKELKDNAMLKVKPELWCEWNFEKNDELGFDIWEMTKSMSKKLWWVCKDCKSEYNSVVYSRTNGTNCPYCSGKKVNHTNCLATKNHQLASEWHPTKNGEWTPYNVTANKSLKAWWICCNCGSEYEAHLKHRINGSSCSYCAGLKANHTNSLASVRPDLAKEWHPTKNERLTPDDVTCGSNKKVWWLCEKGHEWETLVNGRNNKGSGCPCCSGRKAWKGESDMWTTNPELASKLLKKEDGYKYSEYSNKKVDWRCLDCGEIIKNKSINNINICGLSCPKCSDGISYPEKVIYNLLKYLTVDFIREVTCTTLKWTNNKRYDFYIPSLNCIIEAHGEQHYKEGFKSIKTRTLKEERENDNIKYELALNNGIKHYIELDCRESNIEYIRNSIMNSELVKLLDLNNVDWQKISLQSEKSILLEVCKMWNSGMAVDEIIKEIKLSSVTVQKYFERGIKLNICKFTASELRNRGERKFKGLAKADLINELSELWNSGLAVYEIIKKTNLSKNTVIKYLKEGNETGICINYNEKESRIRGNRK